MSLYCWRQITGYKKDQFCKIILFILDKTSQVCGKFQSLRFLNHQFIEFSNRPGIVLTYPTLLFFPRNKKDMDK